MLENNFQIKITCQNSYINSYIKIQESKKSPRVVYTISRLIRTDYSSVKIFLV